MKLIEFANYVINLSFQQFQSSERNVYIFLRISF